MPIVKPAPHLMKSVKLKYAKKQLERKKHASYDVSLNLTPMIDMFVVLTIFLLMTFSTTGEILFIQKDIELPKASQTTDIEQAPVIIVGAGQVVIEGAVMGRIDDIAEDENFEIADLSEKLQTLKKNFQALHPNQTFSGMINIQGDKGVTFRVLKKVMFTCTAAGYTNINFAVLPIGKKGAEGAAPAAGATPPAEG